MVKIKKERIPTTPGVYFFKNKKGEVLYVGKATNLKSRVRGYLRTNPPRADDAGLRFPLQPNSNLSPIKQRLIREVTKIDWEETKSEIEALLLESHYIKKYQPRYNVLLRDDKTFLSVKITNEEYPRVLITRKIEKDGTYFGPFTDARAVKETLKILRQLFPYRTSCMPNSGRACLHYHMGLCPGVCVDKISAKEYQRQIKHIKDFFAGKRQRILNDLKKEFKLLRAISTNSLKRVGGQEQIEKTKPRTVPPHRTGTEVEYKIKNLEKVLMMAHVLSFGEKVEGDVVELTKVLALKKPPHRIEGYDVSNIMGILATASMVVFTDGAADKNEYRKFKIKTVRGANDVAMLKEVLRRRFQHSHCDKDTPQLSRAIATEGGVAKKTKTITDKVKKNAAVWPISDLVVIDGGRPQLGAAMEVWQEFSLKIPLVSLAKRYEEIFIPNQLNPLVLPRTSPALHLLERIRDEAHRFAVSYHKLLRRQKLLSKKKPRTR